MTVPGRTDGKQYAGTHDAVSLYYLQVAPTMLDCTCGCLVMGGYLLFIGIVHSIPLWTPELMQCE